MKLLNSEGYLMQAIKSEDLEKLRALNFPETGCPEIKKGVKAILKEHNITEIKGSTALLKYIKFMAYELFIN